MNNKTFEEQYERATKAAEIADAREPRAMLAQYDPQAKRVVIHLRNGEVVSFAPASIPELASGSVEDLSKLIVSPSGDGLYWPKLDVDIGLLALFKIFSNPSAPESTLVKWDHSILIDQLCEQIEMGWMNSRDATIVDRLAAEYPDCSWELYEFFSLLIEAELSLEPGHEEMAESVRRTSEWLEREGYGMAASIAREESPESTTTMAEQSSMGQPARGSAQNGSAVGGQQQNLGLMGLIQQRTGKDPNDILKEVDVPDNVLLFAQKYPNFTPTGARREIARQVANRYSISEEEGYSAISRTLRRAALRSMPFPQQEPNYVEMIKKSRMSKEEKKRWLAFAIKEAS